MNGQQFFGVFLIVRAAMVLSGSSGVSTVHLSASIGPPILFVNPRAEAADAPEDHGEQKRVYKQVATRITLSDDLL
jgi:hypothetical protein